MELPTLDLTPGRQYLVNGLPTGADALWLREFIGQAPERQILHVSRDDARMDRLAEALAFFAPAVERVRIPAWDCLPYDRVSPHRDVASRRLEGLSRLAEEQSAKPCGRIVLTTVNALLQRVMPKEVLAGARLPIRVGQRVDHDWLTTRLTRFGYARSGTVMEPGEYAVRGGLIDIFPASADSPVRLDQFGDRIDSMRIFDPSDQRASGETDRICLTPISEVMLDAGTIERFRAGYRELFGAATADDPLFAAVSSGKRHLGMEHWMPLFYGRLPTLFDYLGACACVLDHMVGTACDSRLESIADHFQARLDAQSDSIAFNETLYRPLPPQALYLSADEWDARLTETAVLSLSDFDEIPPADVAAVTGCGKPVPNFSEQSRTGNQFEAVAAYLGEARAGGKGVLIACISEGSRDRLARLLGGNGVGPVAFAESWNSARETIAGAVGLVVLGLDHGFEIPGLVVLAEQDILGDRAARTSRRRTSAAFVAEVGDLSVGDLVVHGDHGIGRYDGLATLSHGDVSHDCARLIYEGDDKLFVPVENIDVLTRYGSADGNTNLDRLGASHWQARKARLKRRIQEMAGELLRVAAARRLRPAETFAPPEGEFDAFCARFPFVETEDQLQSIGDVLSDLERGRAMDRLVCGDVGFGKTEVAASGRLRGRPIGTAGRRRRPHDTALQPALRHLFGEVQGFLDENRAAVSAAVGQAGPRGKGRFARR